MASSSLKKICPFCKNYIPFRSEKCPICNMILIERKVFKENKRSSSFEYKDIHKRTGKSFKNNIGFLNRIKFSGVFEFIKTKKDLILFSIIALIIFIFLLSSLFNTTDHKNTIYDFELEKRTSDSKDNSLKDSPPVQNSIEKDNSINIRTNEFNNLQQNDISNNPEKYIKNGKVFFRNKKYFNGMGKLTIKNGTSNDAVVKLVSTSIHESILTIYIRRNSDLAIGKIKDGVYKLYFVLGRHYLEDTQEFLQDCSFLVFNDEFPFTTNQYHMNDVIRTSYSTWEVTLHSVIGGNAKARNISKEEFLML
ncbi:MAG: hypothetical protein KatS3mg002_1673 [Candidatus Woesearchaeota archaeon]|nr:MAG: hypothetical protein KatS3mg002_1673 [Candidatus Woesearchaeota archaeon]